MAKIDSIYHDLLNKIKNEGFRYEDLNRKGIHRLQIPSYTIEHDFKDGFPAITTKQLYWKGVVGELLWILRGDTNIKYLVDNNINIWNKDAYNYYCEQCKIHNVDPCEFEKFILFMKNGKNDKLHFIPSKTNYKLGDLGRVYGAQLRNWRGNLKQLSTEMVSSNHRKTKLGYDNIDQFAELINTLKTNPMATKKTVTFWNPAEKDQCALTPCHWSFEILVEPLNERICLDGGTQQYQFTLKWHQHSVDTFLGLNFNIASYALLAQIIGKMTNMIPKGIIGDLSNVHIYEPHLDAVKEQLSRDVDKYDKTDLLMLDEFHYMTDKELVGELPVDEIINNLRIDMFKLKGYDSYPAIPAEMFVYS